VRDCSVTCDVQNVSWYPRPEETIRHVTNLEHERLAALKTEFPGTLSANDLNILRARAARVNKVVGTLSTDFDRRSREEGDVPFHVAGAMRLLDQTTTTRVQVRVAPDAAQPQDDAIEVEPKDQDENLPVIQEEVPRSDTVEDGTGAMEIETSKTTLTTRSARRKFTKSPYQWLTPQLDYVLQLELGQLVSRL
jgi:hypothetical protein